MRDCNSGGSGVNMSTGGLEFAAIVPRLPLRSVSAWTEWTLTVPAMGTQ